MAAQKHYGQACRGALTHNGNDADDTEEPSVVGKHAHPSEEQTKNIAQRAGETEHGELFLLDDRVWEHMHEQVAAVSGVAACNSLCRWDGQRAKDTSNASEDQEPKLACRDKGRDDRCDT